MDSDAVILPESGSILLNTGTFFSAGASTVEPKPPTSAFTKTANIPSHIAIISIVTSAMTILLETESLSSFSASGLSAS